MRGVDMLVCQENARICFKKKNQNKTLPLDFISNRKDFVYTFL